MEGVVFVTTETIRFLATFLSSLVDSKIISNDGIPAVDWKKNVCEQSAGKSFGSVKKHTGERENNDEVQKTFLVPAQWVCTDFLQLLTGGFLKMKTRHLGLNPVLEIK